MNTVLVVAPHCDDETLGCGGTLLRHVAEGDRVHWVVVTSATVQHGYTLEQASDEMMHIDQVARSLQVVSTHLLKLRPSFLDATPLAVVIEALRGVIQSVQPNIMYVPHSGDAHSDHAVVAQATASSAKWFRSSYVRRILAYETLSETEFEITGDTRFVPNVFVDVSAFLAKKIEIMNHYRTEMGTFPFPRSEQAIRALAAYRGATSGFEAAEGFMLLRELI